MLPFDINSASASASPKGKDNQKHKLQQLYKYLFIGIIMLVFISYSLHNSLRYIIYSTDSGEYNEYYQLAKENMEKHKFAELNQNQNYNRNQPSNNIDNIGNNIGNNIPNPNPNPVPKRISSINHLIIVPGHSAVHINQIGDAATNDNAWYLLPYQTNQQFSSIIMSHINKGLELLEWDESAMLVFSGGQTRHEVGPISEAASYYYVAKENMNQKTQKIQSKSKSNQNHNTDTDTDSVSDMLSRMVLEEYARDSYENLLFSICRFYEMTNNYPVRITIIGFDFKKDRFINLHRNALRFPEAAFSYIGLRVDTRGFNYENAWNGEKSVISSFSTDMYGCGGSSKGRGTGSGGLPVVAETGTGNKNNLTTMKTTSKPPTTTTGTSALYTKKQSRNPFRRSVPYVLSNPALSAIINICQEDNGDTGDGGSGIYTGPLPW